MSSESAITTAMGERPTTALQKFTDYAVMRDDKNFYFGTDGDVKVEFDATRNGVQFLPEGNFVDIRGLNMARDRYELVERFERAPKINADIQNAAEATRMIANPNFEILGTNASSDDSVVHAEGGIHIQTDGADGDEVIVLPHLDANQSAWSIVTWGTDKQVRWEAVIRTGASITNTIIWAGLKLTNTEVTATDNNQAFFRYEDDVNSGKWQAISSNGGTDDAHDTGLAVAVDTTYHLVIEIDSSRVARFYINGTLYETSAALADTTDLIPYIGVAADGAAAAKELYIFKTAISRAPAA